MAKKRKSYRREPNGRPQRPPASERAEDMRQVVMKARENVYGLTDKQAARMPETTELGRLYATGEISPRQYEAGARFSAIARTYDRFILAKGIPSAGDLDRGRGHDSAEVDAAYVNAAKAATRAYSECTRALEEAKAQDRCAPAFTKALCINNLPCPDMTPTVRVGLNALAQVFRLPVESDARGVDKRSEAANVRSV